MMCEFCSDCKYYDTDYEWDDLEEDEIEVVTCRKGHEIPCDDTPCSDFKKYKPRPYKEEFSECDYCEYVSSCNNVIESTIKFDKQRHFVKGMGYCQKKDGDLAKKKLSDIIQISDKLSSIDDRAVLMIKIAIEKFGDITYGEFVKDKVYEMLE